MFELTENEFGILRSQIVTSSWGVCAELMKNAIYFSEKLILFLFRLCNKE